MDINQLRQRMTEITGDKTKPVTDRCLAIFELRDEVFPEESEEKNRFDVECISHLIDTIKKENSTHDFDEALLQLYTALAEAYTNLSDHHSLIHLATDIMKMLNRCVMSYEAIEWGLPKLIDTYASASLNEEVNGLLEAYLYFTEMADSSGMKYDPDTTMKYLEMYLSMQEPRVARPTPTTTYLKILKLAKKLIPADKFHTIIFNR